jgi:hypothetical protein
MGRCLGSISTVSISRLVGQPGWVASVAEGWRDPNWLGPVFDLAYSLLLQERVFAKTVMPLADGFEKGALGSRRRPPYTLLLQS